MSTEAEIRAEIAKVIQEADAAGLDTMAAYKRAFPGAPDGPYWEEWCGIETAKDKAWMDAMVRTIDGEVIRRAASTITSGEPQTPT